MSPHVILYGLLGLVVGSFLNVCIYRIPRGESVAWPGSRCTQCRTPIRPYDNVPILSYLWLRGRCRHCASAISLRYPFVEALTALCFLASATVWNLSATTLVNSTFLSAIIVLVFIDYDHQILPNIITLPGIVAGYVLSSYQSAELFDDALTVGIAEQLFADQAPRLVPLVGSLLGSMAGAGVLFFTAFAYEAIRKKQGLGMGDVKMMGMVGAFLGWRLALLTIFTGSLLGSLAGIFLVTFRGGTLQTKLAFGTFLGGGATLVLFLGPSALQWYLRRF